MINFATLTLDIIAMRVSEMELMPIRQPVGVRWNAVDEAAWQELEPVGGAR
jgi:hypothetical protein